MNPSPVEDDKLAHSNYWRSNEGTHWNHSFNGYNDSGCADLGTASGPPAAEAQPAEDERIEALEQEVMALRKRVAVAETQLVNLWAAQRSTKQMAADSSYSSWELENLKARIRGLEMEQGVVPPLP
jgi:hypothetical protein